MLRHFGAEVTVELAGAGRVITLVGQPELQARDVAVPGDPSSAAFRGRGGAAGAGLVGDRGGVGLNPLRTGLFATLREMGADLAVGRRAGGGRRAGR